MRTTEHTSKPASTPRIGLVAMLCGPLRGRGTGAPEIGRGSGAPSASRPLLLALVAALSLAAFAFAAPAASAADSPWWHLTSTSRPGYLPVGGTGVDPVQELTVHATKGAFYLEDTENGKSDFYPGLFGLGGPLPLSFDATHGEVQTVLEDFYGPHNVEVTKGPLASGTGTVFGPVSATGKLTEGSPTVEEVANAGEFVVGQTIEGAGIPTTPATTIVKIEGETLTLSAAIEAGKSGTGVALSGVASKTVTSVTGAFAVGQELSGKGIPVGTTITAVGTGTLTLSQAPTAAGGEGVRLHVFAPYRIKFLNARPVKLLAAGSYVFPEIYEPPYAPLEIETSPGVFEGGSAQAKQLVEGSFHGSRVAITAANLGSAATSTSACEQVVTKETGKYSNSACTEEQEEGKGEYEIEETPSRIVDTLPEGVEAATVEGAAGYSLEHGEGIGTVDCSIPTPRTVECTFKEPLPSYLLIEVLIGVVVKPSAAVGARNELPNEVSASGGGARRAALVRPLTISGAGEATPFGVSSWEVTPEEEGGQPDTQAGSHPFQVTFSGLLNQNGEAEPVALPKDLLGELPPGLIGNPTAIPTCTLDQFFAQTCEPDTVMGVVMATIREPINVPDAPQQVETFSLPIVNLEAQHGEAARFGFLLPGIAPIYIDVHVRSGEDYGVTAGSTLTSQISGVLGFKLTFWGVPGAPAHNQARQSLGLPALTGENSPPPFLSLPTRCEAPLHTAMLASSWSEPQLHEYEGEPMAQLDGCNRLTFDPSIAVTPDDEEASKPEGLDVDVHVPQGSQVVANGLAQANVKDITVALPQGVAIDPAAGDGLQACSANPGALSSGPPAQLGSPGDEVGYEGEKEFPLEPGVRQLAFTPYLPEAIPAKEALAAHEILESEGTLSPGVNFCSDASKIATVTIHSPLLPVDQPVKGFVYLAAQEANPFGSLIAMYLVAEDPVSGSLVKLPGEVRLCQGAGEVIDGMTCQGLGQIVTTFKNNPQLAFEDAELHFFGGERAPLASPTRCGAYTTTTSIVPWSAEPADEAVLTAHPSATFEVSEGPNHGACPGASLPFAPTLTGGATNLQAGAFSPFTLSMSRLPGEQNLQSVEAHLPPGLSGILSNVSLCPEPQANEGTCPESSLIGETTVAVGVGGEPFTVHGGKFYLTGPYNGSGGCKVSEPGCAPFGLSFAVPAKAGPYDLEKTAAKHPGCDCVLVRGKIEVNPYTAALTITSDPPGNPDAIPTSIEGIPLEIQHINAITTRSNFQFNPTSCEKMEVTGTIHSSEGGLDTIGVPFQVTNCEHLKFTPRFSVSTSGKTSKADGASLSTKVTEPSEPFGSQANIARVKVELPLQLPSRLTTLQKACTDAQFEANPADCPAASKIGYAVVHTPLLPVPLEGPAIFVSHGGEAFPSLTMVLQGYGVTIDLVGTTYISKSGITSTTFKTVPDQPFSSFELNLPEGPYSALAANGNLCKATKTVTVKKKVTVKVHGRKKKELRKVKEQVSTTLAMPNEFIAQNGDEIHQVTPIVVTNCAKAKPAKKKKKKGGKKQGKHGGKGGK